MTRRTLLTGGAALVWAESQFDAAAFDRPRVIRQAQRYLAAKPVTVTAAHSARCAGGLHDFFSEGDYWWPDPANPDGPYIQRDGMTNPDNFVEHRKWLMRLSVEAPALTAAWKLTRERRFADAAAKHIRAWFVDEDTRMTPNLQYAQAIRGRTAGRGTGVIDTIHLVEVARSVPVLAESGSLTQPEFEATRAWFAEYLHWLTTSRNGVEEREAKNNHGTCWVLQVAAFASLTDNPKLLSYAADRFKTAILPGQIAADGSQPLELRRTKPYGYCLFNLEALATVCRILSETNENLWGSCGAALEYMFPYMRDKKSWPFPPDVMYFEDWPMRQQSLLFGGMALGRPAYIDLWKKLPAESSVDEVIRNYFIRQPVLWVASPRA